MKCPKCGQDIETLDIEETTLSQITYDIETGEIDKNESQVSSYSITCPECNEELKDAVEVAEIKQKLYGAE